MTFAILKQRTPQELSRFWEDPGKPTLRVVGGYIADLVALGKAIWLCPLCVRKFDSKRNRYRTMRNLPIVRGYCDGCRERGNNTIFVPVEHRDGWEGYGNV